MAYYNPRNIPPRPPTEEDYRNAVLTNPNYIQGMGDLGAEDVADKSRYGADYARALIDYGVVPTDWADTFGVVNEQVRKAADANTQAGLSTFARIQKQHRDSIRQMKRRLAARGMLRSGDLTGGLQEANLLMRQNQSDSMRKLLDYFSGLQAAYARSQQERAAQQRGLAQDTYWNYRQAGLGPIQSIARPGASVMPGTTDWYSVLPSGIARSMEGL